MSCNVCQLYIYTSLVPQVIFFLWNHFESIIRHGVDTLVWRGALETNEGYYWLSGVLKWFEVWEKSYIESRKKWSRAGNKSVLIEFRVECSLARREKTKLRNLPDQDKFSRESKMWKRITTGLGFCSWKSSDALGWFQRKTRW